MQKTEIIGVVGSNSDKGRTVKSALIAIAVLAAIMTAVSLYVSWVIDSNEIILAPDSDYGKSYVIEPDGETT